jgi:RNA polymerase sigma-70 factor (ECF subfamily)
MSKTGGDDRDDRVTRASMFERLRATDTGSREMAWGDFRHKYAPVIAGFARNLGARPQDIDDIIQDVFLGFYAVSPRFVYDPSKGRFRGYLKVVTLNAIRSRLRDRAKLDTVPLAQLADDAEPIEKSWDESWQQNVMRRALAELREEYAEHPNTFRAFEQYVLKARPAAEVAAELGMKVDSVYQAKHRITDALRDRIKKLGEED